MRLTKSCPATFTQTNEHTLSFKGERGEVYHISVLEQDLIRVQHLPEGSPRLNRTWMVVDANGDMPREGRSRDDLSPFSLPGFDYKYDGLDVVLSTEALTLDIRLKDFSIRWQTHEGETFASDIQYRAYPYDLSSRAVYHYMERRSDEHYYGFGERSGALDKQGRRMRMLNLDSLGYNAETGDPLYKHFPFYITFLPEQQIAYGLFYDNLSTCTFDMGSEISAYHGFYRYYQADDGDIDYYFIYGPSIAEVIEKYACLTGRMILPPRWSLGYLGSTMLYTDAPDAGEQLKQFVDLCQQHDIPCDLFHLSSGYTTGEDTGYRYVFNWNRSKVPDPAAMVDYFHQGGIQLSANIKPYFLASHPHHEELKEKGVFIQEAEDDSPELVRLWAGGVGETENGAYMDFTHPAGFDWWKGKVKETLLDYGIDSTWNDNNEYEIFDDEARCHGFGETTRLGMLRPVQTLLMVMASYQAQVEHAPDQRPFLLCRSGLPGIQRYAQTWSGDNDTSWHTLRWNIPMGLGMSLSGAPNTGHDVGGFYGEKPEPELFIRWLQNGIFHPRFTIHSFNTDGTVNEPWMYPEYTPLVRELIQFRYRLIPYLYTLMFEASQTGKPIMRPLVYQFPEDANCRAESFDFMLGDQLLVASVVEKGQRERAVYLPKGCDWYDYHTRTLYDGGQTVTVAAPLEQIPLFVTAGGMIPMGKVMKHVGAEPDDVRELYIFPLKTGESQFTLIEDDGITLNYQQETYTKVVCITQALTEFISVRVNIVGNYDLPYETMTLIFPQGETRRIQADQIVSSETDIDGRQRVTVRLTLA